MQTQVEHDLSDIRGFNTTFYSCCTAEFRVRLMLQSQAMSNRAHSSTPAPFLTDPRTVPVAPAPRRIAHMPVAPPHAHSPHHGTRTSAPVHAAMQACCTGQRHERRRDHWQHHGSAPTAPIVPITLPGHIELAHSLARGKVSHCVTTTACLLEDSHLCAYEHETAV